MERSARATQRKSRGGGLFGFAKKLTTGGVVGDLVDRFIGAKANLLKPRACAKQHHNAYQREMQ